MSKRKKEDVSVKLATLTTQVEAHNKLLTSLNRTLNDPEKGVLHRLTKIETKLSVITGITLVATPIITTIIFYLVQLLGG